MKPQAELCRNVAYVFVGAGLAFMIGLPYPLFIVVPLICFLVSLSLTFGM